jgi:hypothetical protein
VAIMSDMTRRGFIGAALAGAAVPVLDIEAAQNQRATQAALRVE